ncbi:MAG: hypothetical protein KC421_20550 [Anaerolineales bacterium]|nr:hypothetical protein [Anaerolineales bacterium]
MPEMSPKQFVANWSKIQQKERAVSRADIQELDDVHTALDHAVLHVYGWSHNLTDEQVLECLLELTLERANKKYT